MAFAITAVHESNRKSSGDGSEDLSEETLHWGSKQIDGDLLEGTRMSSADHALRDWGQPVERLWPYDEARDDKHPAYLPPPEAIHPDNCHFSALRSSPFDVATIRQELESGRPVAIGMPVWGAFRMASSQPLPAPSKSELLPTRHAVVVVGHDDHTKAVLIRNSWGAKWGDNGHMWVSEEILQLALGAWVIDVAASDSLALAAEILSKEEER